jgi:hypothetical protein
VRNCQIKSTLPKSRSEPFFDALSLKRWVRTGDAFLRDRLHKLHEKFIPD